MLAIDIPGGPQLRLAHLVLDYNGTLALDGELLAGVTGRLQRLAERLTIHVITADTHGTAREHLTGVPCTFHVIPVREQARAKEEYVDRLGAGFVVAMGNGRNDALMLARAALGVCLLQAEGASTAALASADICCTGILEALDLLIHPKRLQATLRC